MKVPGGWLFPSDSRIIQKKVKKALKSKKSAENQQKNKKRLENRGFNKIR